MSIIQVTATGREHGLIKKIPNSVQGDGFKHMTPEAKEQALKKKKDDGKLIKARYLNKKGLTEYLKKYYCLGGGEPIQEWVFLHEQVYDVPQGLVQEVNAKKTMVRQGKCDENGENPAHKDSFEEFEHRFVPADF